ncbi:MAG: DegT/DnrJ/EryC1/StrS family aminotransferase [Acidobacteriota bacterium]|nr:DegT/DnrJ/EryC1/StrS family aminotransferase [Acidobacteriota bacterium]
MSQLAILGGEPAVSAAKPHEPWPPPATTDELEQLRWQRQHDISIRGKTGPIKALETEFLQFLSSEQAYAITYNSGTSALFAAYFAMGVKAGCEVIGPAYTYHAALSPVFALSGEVVLVDVEPQSRCLDPSLIERAITDRTKVITVVHQWGHPADMDAIMRIADRHNLPILEDCSHAHGSSYRGRLCGTFGAASVFSLQANKAVFAGEGGILITSDSTIHDRATLIGHYRDRSRDETQNEDLQRYWVTGFGLKLRMSPFNAIVASHSLRAFPSLMHQRHQALRAMNTALADVPYIEAPAIAEYVTSMGAWYGYKPIYKADAIEGLSKAQLIKAMVSEGMEVADPSGPPLSALPLYTAGIEPLFGYQRRCPALVSETPVAADLEQRSLSFPTFYRWPNDERTITQYGEAMTKIWDSRRDLVDHFHSGLVPEDM